MRLRDLFLRLIGRGAVQEVEGTRGRGPVTHVILLDGTRSELTPGRETSVGLIYKLLAEGGARAGRTLYYEAGIQWESWRGTLDVMHGRGLNRQIMRAYGALASRYREGDKVFLVGFSRGAYAVRSLAGVIDRVGLIRADCATERMVTLAYRHYRAGGSSPAAEAFRQAHCHAEARIEAVAVFDTVKALGSHLPLLWRLTRHAHAHHNDQLGPATRHGFHALAYDETREAYAPVIWRCPPGWQGHVEQVWFRGTHGDVGGQLGGFLHARPLANIPLVWMLECLEGCGLELPEGWRARFPTDVHAPSVGNWRGWSKIFLARKPRAVGRDPSERLHETLLETLDPSDTRAAPLLRAVELPN